VIESHAPLVKSTTYLQDLIDSNVDRKIKLSKMTYKQILNQNPLNLYLNIKITALIGTCTCI